jgi:hypothetical protein
VAFEHITTTDYPDMATEPVASLVVTTLATAEKFAAIKILDLSKGIRHFSTAEIIQNVATTRKDRVSYALQAEELRQRLPLMPLTDEQKQRLDREYTMVTAQLLTIEY